MTEVRIKARKQSIYKFVEATNGVRFSSLKKKVVYKLKNKLHAFRPLKSLKSCSKTKGEER